MSSNPPLNLQAPRNQLLAALRGPDYQRLAMHLRPVTLPQNLVINEVNQPVERVYFLEDGMISMVLEAADATRGIEVGVLGREGLWGMHTAQDRHASFTRAVMQVGGRGWWLPCDVFCE